MAEHLTEDQILRVANAHIIDGIDQHKLAAIMGVNQGRINEAVRAIRYTMENLYDVYAVARGKARIVSIDGEDK